MTDIADATASTVEEVKTNAANLNLVWALRPASIGDYSDGVANVIMDGDTNTIVALSLIGDLGTGDRVHILQIPPSGSYIVGTAAGASMMQMANFKGSSNGSQQATTSSFTDVLDSSGNPVEVELYKYRETSRIAYNIACDCFASAVGDTVEFGFQIDGTDYAAAGYFFNAALDHRIIAGASVLVDSEDIGAGVYTVTLRWRNPSGTAANMDFNSQLQFQLYEVAPLPA